MMGVFFEQGSGLESDAVSGMLTREGFGDLCAHLPAIFHDANSFCKCTNTKESCN